VIPNFIRILRIVVALAISATIADAGPGIWTSGGPYGGDVMALAVNPATPSTLYAGTDGGGIFKSTDAGGTWSAVNTGLTSPNVRALAINPTTPATLYAGTVFGLGVFKSTDSGATWTVANTGLTSHYVDSLAINPATPTTVYAGTDGGVFRSTDAGATWTAVNTGLTNLVVYALAIDPVTPTTLYAGTNGSGIFKSTNGGSNWAAVNTGLSNSFVYTLAISPSTPATLYAGTDNGPFKSVNGGTNWAAATTGMGSVTVAVLTINPTTPAILYASTASAVFKSTDSGGTWAAANSGLTNQAVMALAINPATPATLYAGAGSGGGVFKSIDSGGAWASANAGITGLSVRSLSINPTTPSTVYAATFVGGGVFKSVNSGGSWTAINTGLTSSLVVTLAINPTTPTTLYAGTTAGGVFKSIDAGGTWAPANNGLTDFFVYALAINPASPAIVYAGTDSGVFKSADSGGTWTAVNAGLTSQSVRSLAIDPATPATVYAGTDGGGVFKSTNAGTGWVAANSGLTNLSVSSLAINPSTPTMLYAGTAAGVFKSTTSGGSWAAANTGLATQTVLSLAINSATPGTLYAGTQSGGVFSSTDAGGTWTATNTGLTSPGLRVNALALDSTGATTLYAGLEAGSVWQFSAVTATAPSITTQPAGQTVTAGATASFSAAASGSPSPTVQWQVSSNSGSTWSDIGGATSTTYAFTAATGDSGKQYRAVFTNSAGTATTSAATLIVNAGGTAPTVTLQPVNQTVTAGATASFSAAASGSPSPTAQWQVSGNSGSTWSDIGGATSTTYAFTAAVGDSGKQYRAVFTNSAGTATTSAATLTVNAGPTAPAVTLQPVNQTVTAGATASFSAAASGSPSPTVQWQASANSGSTWSDIGGATSTTYAFTAAAGDSGRQYRAVFTNSVGSAATNGATLTVNSPPAITTHPANQTVAAGATASFSAAASGSPSPTVQWQVSTNGGTSFTDVGGATAATYSFTTAIADNGKRFRAVFTNVAGTATSNAAILTVSNPTMALDRTSLVFGAVTAGAAFTSQTPAQTVRLTQAGVGPVTWIATSTTPWLVVSPTSGTGPATLTISAQFASGLAASQTGGISLSLTGASNTVGPIGVTLTTTSSTAPASPPFGVIDTPAGDATVLAGSVAVTGWALDNIGVKKVELWRDLQAGETTPPFASTPSDPRTGKAFVANATFVDGARPDVEAMNSTTPLASKAGWGYLLLTWGLWNQGNGTYKLYAFAFDEENNVSTLGSKTIIVSNNTATRPFGTIDTPGIGGDASGPNFGWGLTPKVNGVATCKIPSTGVQVSIDSGPLQPVDYGDARTDIAGAFPGFSNSAGAGGHFIFDWSTLTPGAHTIGWLITDDCNRADGVGSRFFNVTRGASQMAAPDFRLKAETSPDAEFRLKAETTGLVSEDAGPVLVSRGYGELPATVMPDEAGRRTVELRQGERIEVRLPRGFDAAYQLGPDGRRRALPIGSTWDAANAIFYWQPAAPFLGQYRIVFTTGSEGISVRLVITP
jgi:photosystem II stability/assembly factor-like uncharacterized protein